MPVEKVAQGPVSKGSGVWEDRTMKENHMTISTDEAFAQFGAHLQDERVRMTSSPAPAIEKKVSSPSTKKPVIDHTPKTPKAKSSSSKLVPVAFAGAGLLFLGVVVAGLSYRPGGVTSTYEVPDWRAKVSQTEVVSQPVQTEEPQAEPQLSDREAILEDLDEHRKDATRRIVDSGMATWDSVDDPTRLAVVAELKAINKQTVNQLAGTLSPADRQWVLDELNARVESNL